jgi:hypothetical protein
MEDKHEEKFIAIDSICYFLPLLSGLIITDPPQRAGVKWF